MEVIESGLEKIRGGVDCNCVCSRGAGTFMAGNTRATEHGGCSCECSCYTTGTYVNNIANQTMAFNG
jgi:hypothetical protein